MLFDNVPCNGKAPARTETQIAALHRKLLNLFITSRPFSFLAEPIVTLLRSLFACDAGYACSIARDGLQYVAACGALEYLSGTFQTLEKEELHEVIFADHARIFRNNEARRTFRDNSNLNCVIEATISISGRPYGLIGIAAQSSDFFSNSDAQFLQDVAEYIAMLIEKRDVSHMDDERMHLQRTGFVCERFHKIMHPNIVDLLREIGKLKVATYENNFGSVPIILASCFKDIEPLVQCTQEIRELSELCSNAFPPATECRPWEVFDCVCDYLKVQIENVATLVNVREDNLPPISAEFSSLWQVFHAVLLNAIAAIQNAHPSPDHTITAEMFVQGSVFVIKISDTGCGILETDISRAFVPFFTTTPKQNKGIGLTFAWNYTTSIGGNIRLTHNQPQGTVVTLRFPIIDQKPPSDIF